MRKAIIAAIVATALFAVGAFAASFAVDSEDVASGADPVGSCATDVVVTFDDDPVENIGGTFTVETARVTFLNEGAPAATCEPFAATLSLDLDTDVPRDNTANDVVAFEDVDIVIDTDDSVIADFTLTGGITADQIVGAGVLVDGNFLSATPT
ncbi:hypothetical protein NHL50_05765 [Acidimicrobiia bacterium EGI L10123]|uniref:hypothetical protein n=1 Tax=Salinilacustrithrix flava TaxID=2957203 RepID=UPI003D7C2CE9|nr:hypothetical protein [Acidimicrobiia bacterium EGI L10123]